MGCTLPGGVFDGFSPACCMSGGVDFRLLALQISSMCSGFLGSISVGMFRAITLNTLVWNLIDGSIFSQICF